MKWRTCLLLLVLTGCAHVPTDPDERADFERTNDPLEPMNRTIFDVNTALDDHITAPLARTYRRVAPEGFQKGLHNFLANMREPYVAGNEILQGKIKAAADDMGRFMVNSTFGVAGVFDVAGQDGKGPQGHDTDIGITMGIWGVGEGPYLMLPFFGPSNPRDGAGLAADFWIDPVDAELETNGLTWASDTRLGTGLLDTRTQLLDPLADLRRSSLDYYASIRSLYRQKRRAAVGNGDQAADMPPAPGDQP